MRSKMLFFLLVVFSWNQLLSQTVLLRGKVNNEQGDPVANASVSVKGTKTGTTSNEEGEFQLSYAGSGTLIITAVGFQEKQVSLTGQQTLTITLQAVNEEMEEVVVTALGIKRAKRQLTYSTQEVKAETILQSKEPGVLNALTGKVSGVQITSSSGQPGSSSRIVIRGTSSLTGNNEALIVLDGVPINNSQTGQNGPGGGVSRLSDIDPDIIENISVLKGSAASALYGSNAARGVLLISTKNGAANKKATIAVNSQFSFENAILPELQSKYAQGDRGVYQDGETVKGSLVWGPELAGLTHNGVPVSSRNPLKEFFQTGKTWTNTISAQGGGAASNYYLSYSYMDQEGTVPTTDYKRHSAFAKFNNQLTKNLTANFQFNYVSSNNHRVPEGYDLQSPLWTLYTAPFSWNAKPALDEQGNQRVFRYSRNNPYWVLDNIFTDTRNNRFIPIATFTYKPLEWLSITERMGADLYSEQSKYTERPSGPLSTPGMIRDINTNFRQFNHDLIVEATTSLGANFDASFLVGNNAISTYRQTQQVEASGLIIDDFNNISNAETQVPTESYSQVRKLGYYAQANIEYKRFLNISLTGRIDQSSVFEKANRTYQYGSASAGFVFSELVKIPGIDFGKLRFSYSQVGNDNVGAYATKTNYVSSRWNNLPGYQYSSILGNPLLTNERTNELEIGLEARALKGRVGLEVSYFDRQHKDLLSNIELSQGTGFSSTTLNAGSMYNKGIEAMLTVIPVRTEKLNWEVGVNFTRIRNKITNLYEGQTMLTNGQTYLFLGDPYGTFFNTGYERNAKGEILIDNDGLPAVNQSELQKIGNIQPDWLAGLSNSISYGNFNLSFFFDMRKGGDILNSDDRYGYFYGTPKVTEDRSDRVVEGINKSTGLPNTVAVGAQDYYQRLNLIYESIIQDGTYIKLRNVNLSYSIPAKKLTKTPFSSLRLTATGRNLWIHAPNFSGADPEVNSWGTGNGSIGTYAYSVPTSRSFNFTLSFTLK